MLVLCELGAKVVLGYTKNDNHLLLASLYVIERTNNVIGDRESKIHEYDDGVRYNESWDIHIVSSRLETLFVG